MKLVKKIHTFSFLQITNRTVGCKRYFLRVSEVRHAGNTESLSRGNSPGNKLGRQNSQAGRLQAVASRELEVFGCVCEHKNTQ